MDWRKLGPLLAALTLAGAPAVASGPTDPPVPPWLRDAAAAALPTAATDAGLIDVRHASTDDVVQAPTGVMRHTFVITNRTDGPLRLRLGGLAEGPRTIPADWSAPGHTVDPAGTVDLAPRDRMVLTLAAAGVPAGRYEVAIIAERDGRTVAAYQFVVDRHAPLPTESVFLARKDPAQAYTHWLPFAGATATVEFDVKNTAAYAVQVAQPYIQSGVRTVDGATMSSPAEPVTGDVYCGRSGDVGNGAAAVMLPPNTPCRGTVTARVRWPGVYRIRAVAGGPDGGAAAADLVLNVKANGLWAAAVMTAGLMLGSWITRWRTKGRAKAVAQLALATEDDRATRLDAAVRRLGHPALLSRWTAQLDHLVDDVENDRITDVAAPLEAVRRRLDLVERWCGLTYGILELPPGAQPPLVAKSDSLALDLADSGSSDATLTTDLESLDGDILTAAAAPGAVLAGVAPKPGRTRARAGLRASGRVGRAASRVAHRIRRSDAFVDVVSGILVGVTLLSTSWLISPAWGSWADFAGLLTAAMGLQTGATALARPPPQA